MKNLNPEPKKTAVIDVKIGSCENPADKQLANIKTIDTDNTTFLPKRSAAPDMINPPIAIPAKINYMHVTFGLLGDFKIRMSCTNKGYGSIINKGLKIKS